MVDYYETGTLALVERIAAWTILGGLINWLRRGRRLGYVISWDKLDVSDVRHPRLLGHRDDLGPIDLNQKKLT